MEDNAIVNNKSEAYVGYIDYSKHRQFEDFKKEIKKASSFSDFFLPEGIQYLSYNTALFPFRKLLINKLKKENLLLKDIPDDISLDNLHLYIDKKNQNMDFSNQTPVAIALYEMGDDFNQLYKKFLKDVVREIIGESFYYQKTTNFRVFFPHSKGYQGKTNFHTDSMIGHPPQEINLWLPLSQCTDSASLSIMSLEKSKQLLEKCNYNFEHFNFKSTDNDANFIYCNENSKPINVNYGQFVLFDSRCVHGATDNKTDRTRVSFDIRIILKRDYDTARVNYIGTGRKKVKFLLGEYYDENLIL